MTRQVARLQEQVETANGTLAELHEDLEKANSRADKTHKDSLLAMEEVDTAFSSFLTKYSSTRAFYILQITAP